jgi:hypothetical protein
MSSALILFYHCFMEVFPLGERSEFSFLWGATKRKFNLSAAISSRLLKNSGSGFERGKNILSNEKPLFQQPASAWFPPPDLPGEQWRKGRVN